MFGAHAGAGSLPIVTNAGPDARVIIVEDLEATAVFIPNYPRVQAMVNRGLTNLTGRGSLPEAWLSLVSTNDTIGIKVFSTPGPNSGTRPAVARAVAEGLLEAGVPPAKVVIWDKHLIDLRLAGYVDLAKQLGIRAAASSQSGYDEKTFYETALIGNPLWGDLEFGRKVEGTGRKSFVSKLLTTELTKVINVTPLLNHNLAGVSGNLYGLAIGSIDNTLRFESEADRLATAIPEAYALPALGDHVALNIVDGLIAQYEGGERGLLHYSATLNQLRFSKDPVALDVLSVQELDRLRKAAHAPPTVHTNTDLYYNASLLELGVSDLKKIHVEKLPVIQTNPAPRFSAP